MKQQQEIILVFGKMLQELVWMLLWSVLLFDTIQTTQTMCSSRTKTVPVFKASLA